MSRWRGVLVIAVFLGCGRREIPLRERDADLPPQPVVTATPVPTPTPLATLPPAVQPVNVLK